MTDDELLEERIAKAVISALVKRSHIDSDVHRLHHEFIERAIDMAATRAARWEAVIRQLIGWLSIGVVGAFGAMILRWIRDN